MSIVDPSKDPGFYAHSSLCIGFDGEPLGVARTFAWSREGAVQGRQPQAVSQYNPDRESLRWNDAVHDVDASIRHMSESSGKQPRALHLMDLEGDCMEFLADMMAHERSFIVRAKNNRRLDTGRKKVVSKLFETVARSEVRDA